MRIFWSKPNDVELLDGQIKRSRTQRDVGKMRRAVPICVIDDQPFAALSNLQSHHYQINQVGDPGDIRVVEPYAIVLCDLQGVGARLNPQNQGAHLIKEIKNAYPDKYVIAYTGSAQTTLLFRNAKENADDILKKDASIDVWTQTLDDAIERVTNPVLVWKKFRVRLLDHGIAPLELVELEDKFVAGFSSGAEQTKTLLGKKIAKMNIADDVRAIAQGFISSIIFKLVFGP